MAEWICFPDDFEIMLFNKSNAMRYERDVRVFPLCKRAEISATVCFYKEFVLTEENVIDIFYDGDAQVRADGGQYEYGFNGKLVLPAGKHSLSVALFCEDGRLPALFVKSKELQSDGSWFCTDGANKFFPAGCTGIYSPEVSPNNFALPRRKISYSVKECDGAYFYDCGKEVVAAVKFFGVKGNGDIIIYYGESVEEALDSDNCETLDILAAAGREEICTPVPKGFRYFSVKRSGSAAFSSMEVFEEYTPRERVSEFCCSDGEVNKIWDIALYTMDLTTRLFYLDGVKRDRWVWGADAYQSILMNRFSFFDTATTKRTLTALFGLGKNGFSQHINNINAYSFFVIIALWEYYNQTGDAEYVKHVYPRAKSLMEFCLSRLDENGFMTGYPEDWVFVDWSEGNTAEGALSYNQILMYKALKSLSELALETGERKDGENYGAFAQKTYDKIQKTFWCEEGGYFAYSLVEGKLDRKVMKQPNAMAVLFDVVTEEQKSKVLENVFLNDAVKKITTPFMMFFELAAMAKLGEKRVVFKKLKDYWGAMAEEGVTAFWETFDKNESGAEKYAMYGRKYGKSLCHAWGAAPLYIIGEALIGLGVEKGLNVFTPEETDLADFTIKTPVKKGYVTISKKGKEYTVFSDEMPVILRTDADIIKSVDGEICLKGGKTELVSGVRHTLVLN